MQEIVDRIKAAEKAAEDQKAAAVKTADKIVSDAKAAGRKHVDDVIAAASEEAGKITAKAEADSSAQAAEKIVVVKKEAEKIFITAAKFPVIGMQLITGSKAAVLEEAEQLTFSFDADGTVKSGKKAKSAYLPRARLQSVHYPGQRGLGDVLRRQAERFYR